MVNYIKKESCRNWDEIKDSVYCFASKQIGKIGSNTDIGEIGLPPSYGDDMKDFNDKDTIYYAETVKKTTSLNDYAQFLFAKLPENPLEFKKLTKENPELNAAYKPFIFSFEFLK